METATVDPKLKEVDIIIAGGGIMGCAAARQAELCGLSAVVVERRGFLGHELTATGSVCLKSGLGDSLLSLQPGALKKQLLSERLVNGCEPLLFSHPAGSAEREGVCAGILTANGYGIQYLGAKAVLYENEYAPALINAKPPTAKKAYYSFEVENIGYLYEKSYALPEQFGVADSEIKVFDAQKSRTVSVGFGFVPNTENGQDVRTQLGLAAKLKAYEIFKWLRENIEAFYGSSLSFLPEDALIFYSEAKGGLNIKNICPLPVIAEKDFTAAGINKAEQQIRRILSRISADLSKRPPSPARYISGQSVIPAEKCTVGSFGDEALPYRLSRINFDHRLLKNRISTPVLVAGCGTAGAMTASALISESTPFTLIESGSEAGGTSTAGGVLAYWHGFQQGIVTDYDESVMSISEEISGVRQRYNKAAAVLTHCKMLKNPLCRCLFGTAVCGAIAENDKISGAVAAGGQGLMAVDAAVTVDMTGDGVLAYLAGCEYELGDADDGMTQSFSQWGREHWALGSFKDNRYSSDLDVFYIDRYSELLRADFLGHLYNSELDFSPVPNQRESRRIIGELRLSLADIIEGRRFFDTVAVASAPFDAHGLGSHPLCYMKVVTCGETLKAAIPYRCFIPRGTDGLLVGGKAFSGTRDAVCVCRMNADVRNAGYMLGLAAALAVSSGRSVRDIEIGLLRSKLKNLGMLPDFAFEPDAEPAEFETSQNLLSRIILNKKYDHLAENYLDSLYEAKSAENLKPSKPSAAGLYYSAAAEDSENGGINFKAAAAVTVLALHGADGAYTACAQLLLKLAKMVEQIFSKEASDDEREAALKKIERPLCMILTAAAVCGGDGFVPALERLFNALEPFGRLDRADNMYYKTRADHHRIPNYDIYLAAAAAAERTACAAIGQPLERLLNSPLLNSYVTLDKFGTPRPCFMAYLELRLCRAAACCGSLIGYMRLAAYLDDVRHQMRRIAKDALFKLTGQNLKSRAEWEDYLSKHGSFEAKPQKVFVKNSLNGE